MEHLNRRHPLLQLAALIGRMPQQGKARARHEFGVKVSIVTTLKEGLVISAGSMPGNPCDGHTLPKALEQAEILSDGKPDMAFVERGYKGVDVRGVRFGGLVKSAASRAPSKR